MSTTPYQVAKVTALPTVLAPDTIYILITQDTVELHVSNHAGTALASPTAKADLVQGRVPTTQLPNFIDARIDRGAFPSVGLDNVIYIDLTAATSYIWHGNTYRSIGSTAINSDVVTIAPTGSFTATDLQSLLVQIAPTNNPTFTGTVSGITKDMVGLGAVDNTADVDKPVSVATQDLIMQVIQTRAPLINPTFSGTVSGITKDMVGLNAVNNTSDADKPISILTQQSLDLKAPLANPTFTGTVSGITKSMVGLGSVDNTSDALKPISTATQTALSNKADLVNGTVPAAQLPVPPSPIVEADTVAEFPLVGSPEHIYISRTDNGTYRWTTSGYVLIGIPSGTLGSTSVVLTPVGTMSSTNLQDAVAELDAEKAPINSPTFTGTVSGITKDMVGLGSVDNTSDAAKPISTATQAQLDLKAPLANPTFTGTVSGITKAMVGLPNVDDTSDLAKPISTATQAALDTKPTLVNGVVPAAQLPSYVSDISTFANVAAFPVTGTADRIYIDSSSNLTYRWTGAGYAAVGLTSGDINAAAVQFIPGGSITATQTQAAVLQLDTLKAPLASPAFTGTVSGITSAMVGLGNVDNTSDAAKPVSTLTAAQLALKAPLASPAFTGTVTGITKAMVGLPNVDDTSDLAKPVSTATQTALNAKAPISNPTFLGTVSGVTKAMVGLGSVDNTADAAKPISTATQTALDLKAPLANPLFTGSVKVDGVDVKLVPVSARGGAYTLVVSDNAKRIVTSSNITIPANVLAAGHTVLIYNTSASATITITAGAGMSMFPDGVTTAKTSVTLAAKSTAAVLFNSATEVSLLGKGIA